MAMIEDRNKTSHTYDPEIANAVAENILERFYPAFDEMMKKFTELNDQRIENS